MVMVVVAMAAAAAVVWWWWGAPCLPVVDLGTHKRMQAHKPARFTKSGSPSDARHLTQRYIQLAWM